jgi:hypothetical protein
MIIDLPAGHHIMLRMPTDITGCSFKRIYPYETKSTTGRTAHRMSLTRQGTASGYIHMKLKVQLEGQHTECP